MGNNFTKSSIDNAIDDNNIELFDKLIKKNNVIVNGNHLDLSLEYNKFDITVHLINNYNLELNLVHIENTLKNKNIGILIFLYENKLINLNINDVFTISCKYSFRFVDFLYRNFDIDINYQNELPFYNACYYNKIKIVRWLYYRDVEYDINEDKIFKIVCERKNTIVIDFLMTICDRYDVEYIEDEKIYLPMIQDLTVNLIQNDDWLNLILKNKIKIEDNLNNEECIISLEDANFKTNCGHYYNFEHLMKWYLNKNTCPLCNSLIELKNSCVGSKFVQDLAEK